MGASQSADTDSKKQDSIDKKMASGYRHRGARGHTEEHMGEGHTHDHSHLHSHRMTAATEKVKGMNMRKCMVDPKLASQKGRKSPPIKPDDCKVGSIARGLDGRMYVNNGKRWNVAAKCMSDAAVARLDKPKTSSKRARKVASPKRARKVASPKRKTVKMPAKTPKRKPRKSTKK